MEFKYPITQKDVCLAGEASSCIRKTLKRLGIDSALIRRVAIAAYEAELNIAIHAYEGELILVIDSDRLLLRAIDRGPGIEDVELAMQEGYSTASREVQAMGFGAGMGLPNIRKCADELDVETVPDEGTTLHIVFRLEESK